MPLTKVDKFLEDVLSHIKFPFVKDDIRFELESHILEKIDYYMEQGYDSEKAEELSIRDMGDAKEIGILLNKQHNPFLGWLLKITNGMIIFFIILNIYFAGIPFISSLFSKNPINTIPKEDIVYKIDINDDKIKKIQITLNNGETFTETEFYEDLFLFAWEVDNEEQDRYFNNIKGYDSNNNVIFQDEY